MGEGEAAGGHGSVEGGGAYEARKRALSSTRFPGGSNDLSATSSIQIQLLQT